MLVKSAYFEKKADVGMLMNHIPHIIPIAHHVASGATHFLPHVAQSIGHVASSVGNAAGNLISKGYNKGLDSLATDTFTGAVAREAALTVAPSAAIGASLNVLPKAILRKGNTLGNSISRSTLADGIVALKKAGIGHSAATNTPIGMLAHGLSHTQAKTIALGGFNKEVMAQPFIAESLFHNDRPNLLNVNMVRKHLQNAGQFRTLLDQRVAEGQTKIVAAAKKNVGMFASNEDAAMHIASRLERYNTLTSPIVAPARDFLDHAEQVHKELSEDGASGYKMVRAGAKKAETSMNRKLINVPNGLYTDPATQNKPGIINGIKNFTIGTIFGKRPTIKGGISKNGKLPKMGRWDYLKHGDPKDAISEASKIMEKRRDLEDGFVKKLNMSSELQNSVGSGIVPTGPNKEYTHQDVINGFKSGSVLKRTKEVLSTPIDDPSTGGILSKLKTFL